MNTMPIETKSIFASKQFQIAGLQGLASIFTIFQTSYPQVGWVGLVASVLVMIARWRSDGTPVSLAGGTKIR